jgi:hypothetical protein
MSESEREEIILTDEQKKFVDENWDKLNLKELTQKAFNNPKLTGLTREGRAIKGFIAEMNPDAKIKTTKYEKGDNVIELTSEQKLLARNNLGVMSWLELARLAFNNPRLTRLHTESKAMYNYCMEIDPDKIPDDEKLSDSDEYQAPTSIDRLVTRVNKYRFKFNGDKSKVLDKNDLRALDIKNLQALLGYMHTERFIQQASKYTRESDRTLYESSFVRYCYDKPDLLEEEVDNYVALCSEIVTITQIERIIQLMDNQLEEALKGEGSDKKALTMTFNESINNQRDKLNQSKKTYQNLLEKLVGDRSKRLKDKVQQNATIINLIDAVKQEEKRIQLLKLAEKQKMLEATEVDELSNMESVIALIGGITKERAKYG